MPSSNLDTLTDVIDWLHMSEGRKLRSSGDVLLIKKTVLLSGTLNIP